MLRNLIAFIKFNPIVLEPHLFDNLINSKNKTMNNDKEFVWTDELVKEFLSEIFEKDKSKLTVFQDAANYFKQSKQPKRDWEILSYGVGLPDPIILKVKRISDNEVFSIGDKITDRKESRRLEIKSFEIWAHHWLKVKATDNFNYITRNIDTINKCSILFTTEDNVDIYEGDTYWTVEAENNYDMYYSGAAGEESGKTPNRKYFVSENAAKEYQAKHKPKYSEEDMYNCFYAGRLHHPLAGMKYDNFQEYIQSLNK